MGSMHHDVARRAVVSADELWTPVAVSADSQLQAARTMAELALRLARDEFARHHPERALVALHRAWDALAHVPGGEAFEDLVALDLATLEAYAHLTRSDADLAVRAMDGMITRLHG